MTILSSELAVSKNCSLLLSKRIIQLGKNSVNNARCHRRESIEASSVPAPISDKELEDNICKPLSLTGHEVIPDDIQACYCLKKGECDCKIQIQEADTIKQKSSLAGKISAIILKTLAN